jgi:hypothetical protein
LPSPSFWQAPQSELKIIYWLCIDRSKPEKRQGAVRGHDTIENDQRNPSDNSNSGFRQHHLINENRLVKWKLPAKS